MSKLWVWALLVITCLGGGTNAIAAAQSVECLQFKAKLDQNYRWSELEVPEDWESIDPTTPKIRIFYYYRKPQPGQSSIVFFNGGPGGDSHSSYEVLRSNARGRDLPWLFMDQRGTGCSDPYPTYQMLDGPRRLARYGTRSIVSDAEAVRRHEFGNASKWKIFGQSYGGRIVHRYLELAPQSLISAHVHGASVMSNSFAAMALRLRAQHRVGEEFFSRYPEDRALLERVRGLVPKNRCFEVGDNRVCGPAIIDALTVFLGFKNSWSKLDAKILALIGEDSGLNEPYISDYVRDYVFGVFADPGFASAVINRLEITPEQTDRQTCEGAIGLLESEGEDPRHWPYNECRLLEALQAKWESYLKGAGPADPLSLEKINHSLTLNSTLNFYLYSGRLDTFVPAETFAEELRSLGSRVNYINFENSGHEGFYTENRIWDDLDRNALLIKKDDEKPDGFQ